MDNKPSSDVNTLAALLFLVIVSVLSGSTGFALGIVVGILID